MQRGFWYGVTQYCCCCLESPPRRSIDLLRLLSNIRLPSPPTVQCPFQLVPWPRGIPRPSGMSIDSGHQGSSSSAEQTARKSHGKRVTTCRSMVEFSIDSGVVFTATPPVRINCFGWSNNCHCASMMQCQNVPINVHQTEVLEETFCRWIHTSPSLQEEAYSEPGCYRHQQRAYQRKRVQHETNFFHPRFLIPATC